MLKKKSSKHNEHGGADGVNQATLDKLNPDSNAYKYQNGTKEIKIHGETIQNVDSH